MNVLTTACPPGARRDAEADSGEGSEAETDALGAGLVRDAECYLAAQPSLTADRLITATTEDLVRDALAARPIPPVARPTSPVIGSPSPVAGPAGVRLPRGLWRVLPDRLLSLHPGRRGEAVARLRITPAEHLALTALVLDEWGWARTGDGLRTLRGRRCILGAQRVVFQLGYGTHDTATTAGDHINTVLRARGITLPYPHWNEQPHVGAEQALSAVRSAATLAARIQGPSSFSAAARPPAGRIGGGP